MNLWSQAIKSTTKSAFINKYVQFAPTNKCVYCSLFVNRTFINNYHQIWKTCYDWKINIFILIKTVKPLSVNLVAVNNTNVKKKKLFIPKPVKPMCMVDVKCN